MLVFDVSSDTDGGLPSSTPLWLPRKQNEDYQRARFGPYDPASGASR
jgi:hypothetical protein